MAKTNKGKDPGGRPELTEEEKDEIVQKLRPYLQSGIPLQKACLEAQIPRSTVYKVMGEDEVFMGKIRSAQQFMAILLSNGISSQLHQIVSKINHNADTEDGKKRKKITKEEYGFLRWYASNSRLTREEFSPRQEQTILDPEVEIKKMLDTIDEVSDAQGEE